MPIVTIPYRPRPPQDIIHPQLERHRFSVLVAHRRLGKSVLAINHIIKQALKNTREFPRYAYVAPFLKQAKLIAWDYTKKFTAGIPDIKINESELFVELPNGAKCWLVGADNPDAMRGTYFDGVVLDEIAQIKSEVFQEIVLPALSDRNGWAVFMGTPKGQNHFYDLYNQAQKEVAEGNKDWWFGLYRADETGVIKADELAQLKSMQSDAVFRQEFLCDFTAASDNVLITIDQVLTSLAKRYVDVDVMGAPKILGVDPARFGSDRSVIIRRQGLQAVTPKVFSKIDNMTLVGLVAQEIEDYKPDAVFIDAGRGEGVIDRLRQIGHQVMEINFGGSPMHPQVYANKRAEMWDLMKRWIEQGGAIPNVPELKTELCVPTYDFDAANRMRLESKEKIKERMGKSPDIADALALTFAMPVMPKAQLQREILLNRQAQKEWHPYDCLGKDTYDPFGNL